MLCYIFNYTEGTTLISRVVPVHNIYFNVEYAYKLLLDKLVEENLEEIVGDTDSEIHWVLIDTFKKEQHQKFKYCLINVVSLLGEPIVYQKSIGYNNNGNIILNLVSPNGKFTINEPV